jgi:hypothetical protein
MIAEPAAQPRAPTKLGLPNSPSGRLRIQIPTPSPSGPDPPTSPDGRPPYPDHANQPRRPSALSPTTPTSPDGRPPYPDHANQPRRPSALSRDQGSPAVRLIPTKGLRPPALSRPRVSDLSPTNGLRPARTPPTPDHGLRLGPARFIPTKGLRLIPDQWSPPSEKTAYTRPRVSALVPVDSGRWSARNHLRCPPEHGGCASQRGGVAPPEMSDN